MDGFSLRCNNLRCRTVLDNRGVVTTCCHIFCPPCSNNLHLINPPPNTPRRCPACETELLAPDDAVLAVLNPSDDYKSSVLSGLSPSVIMEIAGRGLAFWGYQVTQEVVYQEHCANSLRDKYTKLSADLDTIIHEANTEITRLKEKVKAMEEVEEELKRKNHGLMEAWRDKTRKLAQTQELYHKLKRRTLISQVRSAADENVIQALNFNATSSSRASGQNLSADDIQFLGHAPPHNNNNVFFDQPQPAQQRQSTPAMGMSMRRNRDSAMQEPEFLMTGARVGNVSGGLGRTDPEMRRRGSRGSSRDGGGRAGTYGMGNMIGMMQQEFFGDTPQSRGQETRQRLPPTPMAATQHMRSAMFEQGVNLAATAGGGMPGGGSRGGGAVPLNIMTGNVGVGRSQTVKR